MFTGIKSFLTKIFQKNSSNNYEKHRNGYTCPNCGSNIQLKSYGYECTVCKFKMFGLELEKNITKKEGYIGVHNNPHPQKIKYGIICPSEYEINLDDLSMLNTNNVSYSIFYQEKLKKLINECLNSEATYKRLGYIPHPDSYERIANIARLHEDNELEILICNRYITIVDFYEKIRKKYKFHGIIAKGIPFYMECRKRIEYASHHTPCPNLKHICQEKKIDNTDTKTKLYTQCKSNNIDFEVFEISYSAIRKAYLLSNNIFFERIEDVYLHLLKNKTYKETSYELAPVMQLIQSCCLDYLEYKCITNKECLKNIISSPSVDENIYARSFDVQVSRYKLDRNIIYKKINSSNIDFMIKQWENIYQDELVRRWFPGITSEDMEYLAVGIGKERLCWIANIIFDNEQNSIGWPDVFVYNGKSLLLAEIKTNDCMRDSQIYTWNNLIPTFKPDIAKVVKFKKIKTK